MDGEKDTHTISFTLANDNYHGKFNYILLKSQKKTDLAKYPWSRYSPSKMAAIPRTQKNSLNSQTSRTPMDATPVILPASALDPKSNPHHHDTTRYSATYPAVWSVLTKISCLTTIKIVT